MENFIVKIMDKFGYFGICFLIALENVFPPIPSEVILPFGGFMVSKSDLNLFLMILFATIGSVIGALILYLIGRVLSAERLEKWVDGKVGRALHFKKEDIRKADNWFDKHGSWTVFFCRFVPVVRSLISIPAGMSGMKLFPFIVLTTVGSFIWNGVLIYLGNIMGENWSKITTIFNEYSQIVLILFIIIFILLIIYFIKKRKKD